MFKPGLRYTVPQGWVNAEDLPGNFLLYRQQDPQQGFLGGSYVGVFADVRAASDDCAERSEPRVGATPAELAAWYAQLPGLHVSEPQPVAVGGLKGVSVDLSLRRDWKGTCPWSEGHPVIPLIVGSGMSELHHVVLRQLRVRLVLLEWRNTNVTIEITSVRGQMPDADYTAITKPILESLQFKPMSVSGQPGRP